MQNAVIKVGTFRGLKFPAITSRVGAYRFANRNVRPLKKLNLDALLDEYPVVYETVSKPYSMPGKPVASVKRDETRYHAPDARYPNCFEKPKSIADISPKMFFRIRMKDLHADKTTDRLLDIRLRESVYEEATTSRYEDVYASCNVYDDQYNRTDKGIRFYTSISMDIDWYNIPGLAGMSYYQVHEMLIDFCKQAKIPLPSAIAYTGNGSLMMWHLNKPTTSRIWRRVRLLMKYIQKKFHHFGADENATTPKMWRVNGSLNSKTRNKVRLAWELRTDRGGIAAYKFDDLFDAFVPLARAQYEVIKQRKLENKEKAERRRRERRAEEARQRELMREAGIEIPEETPKKNKEQSPWHRDAEQDVVKYIRGKLSGKIPQGRRDIIMFHLGCIMGQIYDYRTWWAKLNAYADEFLDIDYRQKSFASDLGTLKKMMENLWTTDSAGAMKRRGRQAIYRYSKERIIAALGISRQDMFSLDLKSLVSDDIVDVSRKERNNPKDAHKTQRSRGDVAGQVAAGQQRVENEAMGSHGHQSFDLLSTQESRECTVRQVRSGPYWKMV